MVRTGGLFIAAIVGVGALLLFRGGGGSSGDGGSSVVPDIPVPTPGDFAMVNPINPVTGDGGAVWQGPDPLGLAPDGENNNDLIGVVNPGNLVAGGPVYTGPDPANLGGEADEGDWLDVQEEGAWYQGPDPLGLGGS